MIAALIAVGAVGCSDAKTVGLVSARDRAQPLTPATRAELESRGATCTPNPSGPVLCSWTNGSATCDLTFDQNDLLTRLACTVDGLTFTCTRPSSLYVCSWSDDPGCGDVYDASGAFVGYLCGQELEDRIHPDAGVVDAGPAPDGGQIEDRDAGPAGACQVLSERECLSQQNPSCRPVYCETCDPNTMSPRFMGCFGPNDPIPDCPNPAGCPGDCSTLDQQTCEATSSCHGVYVDQQQCGCAPAGCCTVFDHCASGPADCNQADAFCDRKPPVCEGPYVPSIANGCYEGCALATSCSPEAEVMCNAQVPVFPSFDRDCQADSDCMVGIRQQDCCGTDVAVGVRPGDYQRFVADARLCESQFPICNCPDRGIQTDDGHFVQDAQHVTASCQQGLCVTVAVP